MSEIPSGKELEEYLNSLIYLKDGDGELAPMELPRLLLALALEGRAVKDDNLRSTSLHVLDMAHRLGVLPEVDGVLSTAVYLTAAHTLSNYKRLWESPIRNAAAALYGDFPLSPAREKLRQEYLRLVGSILSHEKSLKESGGVFTEDDAWWHETVYREAWSVLREFISNDVLEEDGTFLLDTPIPGESRITWTDYLWGEWEGELRWDSYKRNIMLNMWDRIAQWGRSNQAGFTQLVDGACPLSRGLDATMCSLQATYGEEAMNSLITLAKSVVNYGAYMDELLSHFTTLTWEKLITFASLLEEYNAEWAFAAVEWE